MPRIAALLLVLFAAGARAQVDDFTVLPYIPRAGQAHEAFIQLRNPLDTAWAFTIDLFDFEGTHVATAVAYVPPRSVQWVNSHDLEHGTDGNEDKDVVVHVDPHERGQGDVLWGRVKPPLPPRVSLHAYLRSRTGFVTEMSQGSGMDGTVEGFEGDFQVLPFFNPASNRVQRSSLRLVNTHPNRRRTLSIVRVDDAFRHGGGLACTIPPLGVLTLTASELEGGGSFECDGAFRDGTGKWTVHVRAADTFREPIIAMSLLHNAATGDIVNLSAPIPETFQWPPPPPPRPPTDTYTVLPYIPRAGQAHEAAIQIRNPEYTSNAFTIDLFDREGTHVATDVAYVPPRSVRWVNSRDLEYGTDGNDDKDVVVHVDRHVDWDDLDPDAVLWGRVKPPLPLRVSLHAYLRSRTGFVTGMSQGSGIINDVTPADQDDDFYILLEENRWFQVLPFFNPASNRVQRSSLRIVNTSRYYRWVLAVIGVDDDFEAHETIYCSIPPLAVLTFTASQLESASGPFECVAGLGDGEGKWTVGVGHRLPPIPTPPPPQPPIPIPPVPPRPPPYTSPTQLHDEPIVVMSLLRNTAHPGATADDITNLSAPIPEQFEGEGSPAGRLNVVVVDDADGCPPLAGCVTVRNEGRYRSRPATLVWWWGGFLATGAYQERRAADGTAIPALEPRVNRAFTVEPPTMDTAFAADPYLWVCVVDEDGQPRNCSRRFRDTFDVALVDGARGCSPRAGCVTVRNEGRYRSSRPATLVWWTGEHLATGVYQERLFDSTDVPVLAPGETRVLAAAPPARGTAFVTDFRVCVVDLRDGRQHGCSRKFRDTRF